MKVAIIGTVGVPACYGGYETLVENLLTYRENDQIEYIVYCSSKTYKKKQASYKGAKLVYIPFEANGGQAVIYDNLSLLHAYAHADVIVSLGTLCGYLLPVTKLFSRKRVLVNLDGLDNKRAKFSLLPRLIIGTARRLSSKLAFACISDNQGIKDYAKDVYKRDTELIEYGGDNAKPVYDDERLKSKYGLSPREYVFKVARIEPENNIEMILEAFSKMTSETIVIVGNWNRSEFGKMMREKYGRFANIQMLDPIYEPEEINLLRANCKLYIHGHSAGGTNPSLVEAMNLGLPIIAYDVVYNRETTEHKARYFNSVKTLVSIVKELCSDEKTRMAIASDMEETGKRRYTWKRICNLYERLILSD